jgi:hypothetical protein
VSLLGGTPSARASRLTPQVLDPTGEGMSLRFAQKVQTLRWSWMDDAMPNRKS